MRRPGTRQFGFLGWLALGLGLGVASLALFDPTRGAARRAMIRDEFSSRARRLGERARGLRAHASDRLRGVIHETRAHLSERGMRGVTDVVERLDVHDEPGSEPSLQGPGSRQAR